MCTAQGQLIQACCISTTTKKKVIFRQRRIPGRGRSLGLVCIWTPHYSRQEYRWHIDSQSNRVRVKWNWLMCAYRNRRWSTSIGVPHVVIFFTPLTAVFKANRRYSQCDYLFSFEHRNKCRHIQQAECVCVCVWVLCIDVVSNKIYVICK